jgi:RHS repeat-associated protein
MEAMGATDMRTAVGTIAAFLAAQDIYKQAQSPGRDVAGVLAQSWWADQIAGNVVTVSMGTSTRQFVKVPNGSFITPGGGSHASLAVTGSRVAYQNLCGIPMDGFDYAPTYAASRGWDYSNMSFAVTNAGGDVQNFGYWQYWYDDDTENGCHQHLGFRLTSWSFPQGVTVNLSYAPNNGAYSLDTIASVTNSLGRQLNFGYDSATARLTSLADPASGHTVSFGLSPASHTDAAGAVTTFVYTPVLTASPTQRPIPYQEVSQIFTADNASLPNIEYDYDSLGRVKQIQDADRLQLSNRNAWQFYIADGTRGERDDPLFDPVNNPSDLGYTVIFDTKNRPVRFLDEIGRETDLGYDGRARIVSYTYPEGDQEFLTYDVRSNVTSLTEHAKPGSSLSDVVIQATYNEGPTVASCANPVTCNKRVTTTNGNGFTTNYTFDSTTGLLTQALKPADPSGNRPEADYAYTAYGSGFKLLSQSTQVISSAQSLVTTYAYNSSNYFVPQSITVDPTGLNATTSFTFDISGNLTESVGPRTDVSQISDYTYDPDRRLVFSIGPDPDGAGPHLRIASKTTYDAVGRVIEVDQGTTSSATGSDFASLKTVTSSYDPAGNKLQDTEYDVYTPSSPTTGIFSVTQYSYDGANRKLCTAKRLNSAAFGSLPSDACQLSTSGNYGVDQIGKLVYDPAGQVLQELRAFGTPLQEAYETHAYTPDGKEASVYDAMGTSHTTSYVYDGFNRLATTTFADGTTEQLTYDADNNVLTRINRSGQTLTYGYDHLDRLQTKLVPSTSANPADTVSWTYDLGDKVLTLSDTQGHSLTDSYDTAGRLLSVARVAPGLASQTIAYQYDVAGNRTRLTWPDGYYAGYCYDAANRLTGVQENASDAACATTKLASYDYDSLGRRAWVQYPSTAKQALSWSVEGDLLTLAQTFVDTSKNTSFTDVYSPAHQIGSSDVSSALYQYQPGAVATDNFAAVNVLNEYPSITFSGQAAKTQTYDTRGNLTNDGTFAYAYDPENRLVSATKSDNSVQAAYLYDPLGRRVKKSGTGVATTYFLDDPGTAGKAGEDNEIAEYDGSGNLLRRFIPGPAINDNVAMVAGTTHTYFHTDKIGSIVAMSDVNGNLAEGPYTYDGYGNGAPATGVPFKFAGMRLDPETGLYYDRARYYSSVDGRFLQTDPIGYKDDVDFYTYVGNDPTDRTDVDGKCGALIAVCIGAAIGAVTGAAVEVASQVAKGDLQKGVAQALHGNVGLLGRDLAKIGVSTVSGAVTGAVSGAVATAGAGALVATGVSVASGAVVGAVTGASKAAIDGKDVRQGAVNGSIGGAVGGLTGSVAGQGLKAVVGATTAGEIGTVTKAGITAASSTTGKLVNTMVIQPLLPKPKACVTTCAP